MSGGTLGPVPRTAWTLLLYSVVAIAFTWPLSTDPFGIHLSPQFDVYSAAWLVHAAPSVDGGLLSPVSSWPLGESFSRADSFVLLGLGRVLGPVVGAWPLVSFCMLAGPVFSAWAAERFAARALGATWPASLIAGLAYGYSGIIATALLEGHVYVMFNPWLPLLAWKGLDVIRPGARPADGIWAGVWWSLCLWTSAYVGIAATLLVGVLGAAALVRVGLPRAGAAGGERLAPVAGRVIGAFLAVTIPIGLLYSALFLGGGATERPDRTLLSPALGGALSVGSTRFATLIGTTPSVDLLGHSVAPSLGITPLVLALLAFRVLRGTSGWRTMAVAGWLAVALSFGAYLELSTVDLQIPWLLWPLDRLPGGSFFRFPGRLMVLGSLALGGVAAVVATRLGGRVGYAPVLLVFAAALDPFVQTRVTTRVVQAPLVTPSAYAAAPADLAVLDLFPSFYADHGDLELYTNNLSCAYQVTHGRPILAQCLGTDFNAGPRWRVSGWLGAALLSGASGEGLVAPLSSMGVGAVAFHPDLFVASDREALSAGLASTFGAPLAESADGGERVVVYGVPVTATNAASRVEAYRALVY